MRPQLFGTVTAFMGFDGHQAYAVAPGVVPVPLWSDERIAPRASDVERLPLWFCTAVRVCFDTLQGGCSCLVDRIASSTCRCAER